MRTLITDVVPLFERVSGIAVEAEFRLTAVLQKEIEGGVAFDLAFLPRPELEDLARLGKIGADIVDIARSTVGLAVRAGAPRPDISSVSALKQTLLAAKTIAYSDGPSGAYVAELLQRLGIAEAMKPKTKLTSKPVAELMASGEAEVGMQQIVAILPVKGAELVGPLPPELQNIITYAFGISSRAGEPAAARGFTKFMAAPEAIRLIRAKGLEPG